jgi:hypothetical protein
MALFPFNSQELLQVGGGGHRLHCSDAACSGGPSERSPTCLSSCNCCWCSSRQILFCLSTLGSHKWDSDDPKGRRVVVVTQTAASTPYVTTCVNMAGHIVLESTVPAAVPTPISVLRRRFGPHVSYLKVLHVDNPPPATPRRLESSYNLYACTGCNKVGTFVRTYVCMCVCMYVCIFFKYIYWHAPLH